jgi:predicted metal-dependent phosphoesterase TrpH
VRVDLHCHSTLSDGTEPPEAIKARAERRGLALFALTDHDSCAGSDVACADFSAGVAVRGTELSAIEDGRTVHLLCFDAARDGRFAALGQHLAEVVLARRRRVHLVADRLALRGVALDVDAVFRLAGEATVGRPHIARQLVAQKVVRSTAEAFDRFLRDGGPADVPIAQVTVKDAVALGRDVGARMALAHPHSLGTMAGAIVQRHKHDGLGGLEAVCHGYGARERAEWIAMAEREGLIVTAGSDFHGELMPQVGDLGVELDDERGRRLSEWLGVG